jgi:hypothetical protein
MIAFLAAAAIVVGCSDRMEVVAQPWPVASSANIGVGPVLFTGMRGYEAGLPHLRQPNGWYFAKTPTAVHAGPAVTLTVAAADRSWARLTYGQVASATALTLEPCDPATPRFSGGGTVGVWTGFAGGFLVKHAGCVHFTVAARGRRPRSARVGIGRACP